MAAAEPWDTPRSPSLPRARETADVGRAGTSKRDSAAASSIARAERPALRLEEDEEDQVDERPSVAAEPDAVSRAGDEDEDEDEDDGATSGSGPPSALGAVATAAAASAA